MCLQFWLAGQHSVHAMSVRVMVSAPGQAELWQTEVSMDDTWKSVLELYAAAHCFPTKSLVFWSGDTLVASGGQVSDATSGRAGLVLISAGRRAGGGGRTVRSDASKKHKYVRRKTKTSALVGAANARDGKASLSLAEAPSEARKPSIFDAMSPPKKEAE